MFTKNILKANEDAKRLTVISSTFSAILIVGLSFFLINWLNPRNKSKREDRVTLQNILRQIASRYGYEIFHHAHKLTLDLLNQITLGEKADPVRLDISMAIVKKMCDDNNTYAREDQNSLAINSTSLSIPKCLVATGMSIMPFSYSVTFMLSFWTHMLHDIINATKTVTVTKVKEIVNEHLQSMTFGKQ